MTDTHSHGHAHTELPLTYKHSHRHIHKHSKPTIDRPSEHAKPKKAHRGRLEVVVHLDIDGVPEADLRQAPLRGTFTINPAAARSPRESHDSVDQDEAPTIDFAPCFRECDRLFSVEAAGSIWPVSELEAAGVQAVDSEDIDSGSEEEGEFSFGFLTLATVVSALKSQCSSNSTLRARCAHVKHVVIGGCELLPEDMKQIPDIVDCFPACREVRLFGGEVSLEHADDVLDLVRVLGDSICVRVALWPTYQRNMKQAEGFEALKAFLVKHREDLALPRLLWLGKYQLESESLAEAAAGLGEAEDSELMQSVVRWHTNFYSQE